MIRPALQDEDFLNDVRNAAAEDAANAHLWWLGQSGFLLQWQDRHLLTDPYLSDSLTHKYAKTDRPHVRMTEIVVRPECLNFIDVVTSSHVHTDHLDAETLQVLMRANPKLELVIPEANREVAVDRVGAMAEWPRGLDAGKWTQIYKFKIHAVPAAHNDLERDSWGRHKFLGYVIEAGPWIFYHAGDTLRYPGMEEWLRRWPIDVAILPINGDRPDRGVAGNLDGYEAAKLAKDIGAQICIPCHYEMFEFNTETPETFAATCDKLGQRHKVLRCGERWSTGELPEF